MLWRDVMWESAHHYASTELKAMGLPAPAVFAIVVSSVLLAIVSIVCCFWHRRYMKGQVQRMESEMREMKLKADIKLELVGAEGASLVGEVTVEEEAAAKVQSGVCTGGAAVTVGGM